LPALRRSCPQFDSHEFVRSMGHRIPRGTRSGVVTVPRDRRLTPTRSSMPSTGDPRHPRAPRDEPDQDPFEARPVRHPTAMTGEWMQPGPMLRDQRRRRARTASTTRGDSASMNATSTFVVTGTAPGSSPGHHNDGWTFTYWRALLGVSVERRCPSSPSSSPIQMPDRVSRYPEVRPHDLRSFRPF